MLESYWNHHLPPDFFQVPVTVGAFGADRDTDVCVLELEELEELEDVFPLFVDVLEEPLGVDFAITRFRIPAFIADVGRRLLEKRSCLCCAQARIVSEEQCGNACYGR